MVEIKKPSQPVRPEVVKLVEAQVRKQLRQNQDKKNPHHLPKGSDRKMGKCKCDQCEEIVNGDFAPGHDQRLRIDLERKVGGLLKLKELVYACERYAAGKANESEILLTIRKILAK